MPGGIVTVWRKTRRQTMSINAAIPSSRPLATPGALLEDVSSDELPDQPAGGSAGIGNEGRDA